MKTELPQGFHFRESDHSYFMDGKKMTGCTTILNVLNKPALVGWASRMATEFVDAASEEVSIDGEKRYGVVKADEEEWTAFLQDAKNAHTRKRDARAAEGTDLHALVEEYVKLMIADQDGKPLGMNDDPTHKWEPLAPFIEWAQKENIRFLSSEQKFYSTSLFVAGTADLTLEKDGKRYIGDIKNKDKIWSREPMAQCAGYSIMAEEMGEKTYDGYCVIRLWEKDIEVLWSYDTEGDKQAFLSCVNLYRWLANWK